MSEEEKKARDYLKENSLVRIENEKIVAYGNSYKLVLLNLIERQQKEIEEKNKDIKRLVVELKDNEFDYTTIYMSGVYDGEKKVKDKIKEKIKELKQIIEFEKPTYEDCLKYTIDILEELLEEN